MNILSSNYSSEFLFPPPFGRDHTIVGWVVLSAANGRLTQWLCDYKDIATCVTVDTMLLPKPSAGVDFGSESGVEASRKPKR